MKFPRSIGIAPAPAKVAGKAFAWLSFLFSFQGIDARRFFDN
jgi:hypothetical protein